ncbi:MAG: hypothetical protein P8Y01_12810 [Woeseiaceae bacterium]
MNPMMRRRHQQSLEWPEAIDQPRVYPELVDEVDGIDRDQNLEGESDHEQRQVENPAEQEPRAGLPQCRRKIVFLALVVHGMGRPEDRNLVAAPMEPVIAKVPGDGRQDPHRDAERRQTKPGQRHVDERQMLQDIAPADQGQELREVPGCRAEHSGADAVDRVVAAIVTGVSSPVDDQLDDDGQQEERDSERNQVHYASLR